MACAGKSAALIVVCTMAAIGMHAPARAVAKPSSGVAIELRPDVKIRKAKVSLGDIAYLTTQDLPMLRELMALPLGAAPRPGAPAVLDRETVERRIHATSGVFPIRWAGPGEIEIESATQHLPGEVVVDAAESALAQWLSGRSLRAEVRPLSMARDLVLPAGKPTLRVRPLSSQGMPSRRMLVWVDAWVDDRFVRTTAVSFEVGAWASVPVAMADVGRGTPVDPIVLKGALQEQEIDLTAVRNSRPVASAKAQSFLTAGTRQLRRPLRSGEALTEAHLAPVLAVTRGSRADLLARSGNVTVQSRVEVLQDGRTGEVVRVKVGGATGEVLARVTGPGQVEAQP